MFDKEIFTYITMSNRFEDNNNKKNKVKSKTKPIKTKTTFKPTIIKKDVPLNLDNIIKKNDTEVKEVKNIIENPLDKLDNFSDLLKLAKMAKSKENEDIQYILPIQKLSKILEPLEELNKVIGLNKIKDSLVDQIIYLVTHSDEKEPPMLHTIIDGPPGTGKTKIARIIGKIISNIGYLKKNDKKESKQNFTSIAKLLKDSLVIDIVPTKKPKREEGVVKYVTRSDLVGGYLGQTAMKTQKAIDEASGGVLIIDEAYSLGGKRGNEDTDSYSQECIDTLVSNLSENRSFVCIILGYEDEIKNSFISKNKGMESRFPFKYTIKKYTIKNLLEILKSKISTDGYTFEDCKFEVFLKKKAEDFKYLGRDMETLWFKIKMIQTRRCFIDNSNKNKILEKDVEKGLEKFFINRKPEEQNMAYLSFYT